jgi:hypothetical protein
MFHELLKRLRYKAPMGIERPVPGGLYLWLVHPTRFACVMRMFCTAARIGEMFRSEALLATKPTGCSWTGTCARDICRSKKAISTAAGTRRADAAERSMSAVLCRALPNAPALSE